MAKRKRPPKQQIMLVLEGGPHNCPVPIPRNDVAPGAERIRLPHWYGSVTYRLVGIDDKRVHRYAYEENHDGQGQQG